MEWIQVRTMEQLEQCFTVRRAVFVEEQQVPESVEIDEYDVSPDACRHWLVRKKGTPVAAGRWRDYAPHTAKLQRVAVLASYRGQSIGSQLIGVLEKDARQQGCHKAVLDAQCTAIEFYEKLGYVNVSEKPFLDAGIWHVRMEKELG